MTSTMSAESVHSYRARWILPVDSDPIANGVIEITEGRISALHALHDPRAFDLGNVAIIPGLVNAHAHLEFSDLNAPLGPACPFTSWIRSVVGSRRGRTASAEALVRRGRQESARAGTTALAEILTDESTLPALREPGPTVFALREIIGLLPEQVVPQVEVARRFLHEQERQSNSSLKRGLSPHAPYSVHPELFRELIDLAASQRVLTAVHLAETREELELLSAGTGPFVDMLKHFGVWSEAAIPRGSSPIDYLRPMGKLDRGLVVHGNYLSAADLDYLAAKPHLAVVYCPRTHAYFGHSPHPWLELFGRGGSVAIGTDSRASNPDLSLWRELCFLRERYPSVDSQLLLKLGTIHGARALGLPENDWSLTVGGAANLTVIDLAASVSGDAYNELMIESNSPRRAMSRGQWIA